MAEPQGFFDRYSGLVDESLDDSTPIEKRTEGFESFFQEDVDIPSVAPSTLTGKYARGFGSGLSQLDSDTDYFQALVQR